MNQKRVIKIGLFVLLVAALVGFFAFDMQQYATLDYIKQQKQALLAYYAKNSLLVLSVFGLLYVVVTALSLPVAAALTLLGGAIFGMFLGVIVVSFASTMGATLAFLMARFLARDYVQKNYRTQLAKVNAGFEREGAFYLFAMRLVPAFPFFMINVVMALMPIKTWTFYWVSQLGMLPGTVVYIYAGTELAEINSFSDIASPSLLMAFAFLGLFPLLAKKLVQFMRKEKNG